MKAIRILAAITLLGGPAVGLAQVNMPNPAAPGNSPDSAVRIVATSDLMVDRFITRWLRQHYPGWTADPHQFMNIGFERYAVVYISSPDNPGRRIYFRVMRDQNEDERSPFPDR
ncbi:MAG TPA: hypothetical protein VFP37_04030 [Steroidobacteraceae bacterium]|nr:hypothetical protein [Steroidobacteraceae bacterium]